MWLMLVLVSVLLVLAVALVVDGPGRPEHTDDVDALFIAGIAVTGASAALMATMGLAAIPIALVGVVCIVVGASRNHRHHSGA